MSGFRITAADVPAELSDDRREAGLAWFTLASSDRTPSEALSCGVAEWQPGGVLLNHRHEEPEIYFGLEGSGTVTIDGEAHEIGPGVLLYVPGNAWHETLAGPDGLRIFYAFPVADYESIRFEMPEGASA